MINKGDYYNMNKKAWSIGIIVPILILLVFLVFKIYQESIGIYSQTDHRQDGIYQQYLSRFGKTYSTYREYKMRKKLFHA